MKKSLFFSFVALVFSMINTNAQTVWNFSNWDVVTGHSENKVINNLAIIQGVGITTMGQVEGNTATFPDFSATKRFKFNGGSYDTGVTSFVMPTKRYIYFAANGNCSIKIWYKNGGSGDRTLYVTNGTSVIASNTYSNSTDGLVYTAEYSGPATNIYIAANQALNIYKIEVTGSLGTTTLLGVNDINANMKTNAFSSGNKVYVSNVSKNTEVNVYSISGALVKTLKTSSDLNFELNNAGIYIVNLKSTEGIKSVKVSVR